MVCAQEAMWKIFSFPLYKVYHSIVRLQIHLTNQQSVRYYDYQTLDEILSDERNLRTTLTEFFVTNARDPRARELLYREFPERYCWDTKIKEWKRRRSTQKSIGRVYTVPSCAGEVGFLRHILNHVRGPTSFDDLLFVNGERCRTFKRAVEKLGLLENDQSARASLAEAATIKMSYALRRQFASILHFCNPTAMRELWDKFCNNMVEDYSSLSATSSTFLSDRLLRKPNMILKQHDKDIFMYDLPPIVGTLGEEVEISSLIQEELSIPIFDEDLSSVQKLNEDQSRAYNTIMGAIERKENKVFFIDGLGGTGKTYLYRAILATIRKNGGIALATATSGIAATMLPGGRTAHSRFQLPMTPTSTSMCRTKKQTEEAKLLRHAIILMWDEATMSHRYSLEAFDRMMRDITGIAEPFGGKILIMGGDFCQVLPVILRSTRG
ncbi:ATP-dependent DNA helicase PIF1-like isoform X1 [Papaver somniferum]|uniref:ATP-dependent DNA helicase PIF1-like isoform X1 n=1 Tax=Papaver somniferum TaxID=3469 RepID=UPI000E6FE853|nr:ATP-dependent DNA helicase PIF1-like isoform X1 [Papaver somniferum]XP_026434865.1 ATP-dependent DNA helicase PIF1-like isoform X1 [Papaver somniferum]